MHYIIYNGIDLSVFKPVDRMIFRKKYGLESKFIILGVANVWTERKGIKYFFKLLKYLDEDSKIVLVGLNKKQIKSLPFNIIGIEKTNNIEKLFEIYSAADVFVNPTLEDNFPTVNLEALACGTPVITFNTGGSVESINEDCGIIVRKGDINGLINAIDRIRKMEINMNICISNSKNFDSNIMLENYGNLYLTLRGKRD